MKKVILQSLILLGIGFALYLIANSLISDLFTRRYVYFQICVLLVVLGVLLWKKGWHAHTNTAASILTIVGVLGTFIGIFIGLQEFTISNDSDEMQESISKLLDALKFAFGTSIVGIGSALLLKGAISPIAKHVQNEINPDENAMEKFINGLKIALEPGVIPLKLDGLTETIKEESIETRKILDSIKTELTNGQREQGKQTRNTLTEMQSALIEGQTNTITHLQSLTETVNGVTPALAALETSLINKHTDTLTQLETLTTTVSEKQDAFLNGVVPLLTTIQDSQTNEEIGVLAKLEVLTTTVSEKQSELLNGVKDALTPIQTSLADEQASVLTKFDTLTTTVSEKHDALKDKFETFSINVSETFSKLATEELIKALESVIDEFNMNMVKQFGDNFRHLNEAVDRMVDWQKDHRENMEKLTEEFQVATESIERSRVSLENIVNSSSAIVERSDSIIACAEKLEPILHTMNGQLETFSELRQKAEDSLPVINENIEKLTTQFSSKVEEVIDASKASMETQRTALERQSQQLDNDLRQNVQNIRDGLEQALTESLNGLAGQLTSLSRQFVEDYEPLTMRLQRLVDMARNVEDEPNF